MLLKPHENIQIVHSQTNNVGGYLCCGSFDFSDIADWEIESVKTKIEYGKRFIVIYVS